MNENIFDILKYGEYRPIYYRKLIEQYFEQESYSSLSDWSIHNFGHELFIEHSKHYDHQYATTHHVRIDVYYDHSIESTVVTLSIIDRDIQQRIVDKNYDVHIQTKIVTDDKFLQYFDEFYKEMNEACQGIWYQMENSDE
jgi:hypothetical protein